MIRTYQIHRRKNVEMYDYAGGYLGCVDAHSRQIALKKAEKRFKISRTDLKTVCQSE